MTCIVGVIEKEAVFIGADSAGVQGLDIIIRKDQKVFIVKDFVIGCTSSFRMIQLLQFSFFPPEKHDDVEVFKYMCTDFIDALRQCFKNGGFAEKDREVESGGCFLVGFKGRLFNIGSDYQVAESIDNHEAIGCGGVFAIGALDALNKKIPVKKRIIKSLEIAAYRSAGVRPPFIIKSI